MANKKIIYTIGFQADVKDFKKQMESASKSLTELTKFNFQKANFNGINESLVQSTQSAGKLKLMLEQATNVKTGQLNLTKFRQQIENSGKSIKDYAKDLKNLGPEGSKAFLQVANAVAQSNAPLVQSTRLLDSFWASLKRTAQFQISTSIYRDIVGSISSAYNYAQDLNDSLNKIRIVTGQSAEQMSQFAKQANNAAKELRTTTTEYTDASLIFYQQGLDDKKVQERTDVTIKMANVTKDSANDVSSYMTAIWNNFDDGSKSLESYADTITALGAATASSSAEIAAGVEKYAAVANQIGLSYDYATTALATVVAQTRQSEDVVGTAFKTMFARIQGLQLGEQQDDGTTLNKYSEALYKVGINIKDTNGEIKKMDDILNDLGQKWNTLGKDQQIALAQTVAGVRQYTQLVALMDNWETFQKNLTVAQTSQGSLDKQARIYAESWDAARKKVQASLEGIYDSMLDDKFFVDITNGFADALDGINNVVDALGGMKGILLSIGYVFTSLFKDKIAATLELTAKNAASLAYNGKQKNLDFRQEIVDTAVSQVDQSSYGMTEELAYSQQIANQQELVKIQTQITEQKRLELEAQYKTIGELQRQVALRGEELEDMKQAVKETENLIKLNNLASSSTEKQFNANNQKLNTSLYEQFGTSEQINKETFSDLIKKQTEYEYIKEQLDTSQYFEANDSDKQKIIEQLTQSLGEDYQKIISQVAQNADSILSNDEMIELEFEYERSLGGTNEEIQERVVLLEQLRTETRDQIEQTHRLNNVNRLATQQQEAYNKALQEAQASSIYKGIVELTNKISQYGMALQAVKNIGSIFSDEDLSDGEKLTQLITTITAATPALLNIIAAIKAATQNNGVGLLEALLGHNAVLVLPYLAGIAAVLGSIYAVYKYINKERDKAKALEKQVENLSSALDEAKNKTEELRNSIESYRESRSAIDELTEGTQEYTQAIEEANEKTLELLKNNPKLWSSVSTDQRGLITIDENALKQLQEEQIKQQNLIYRSYLQSQIDSNNQQLVIQRQELQKKVRKNYSGRYEDFDWYNSNAFSQIDRYLKGQTKIEKLDDSLEELIPEIEELKKAVQNNNKATSELNKSILRSQIEELQIGGFQNLTEAQKNFVVSQTNAKFNIDEYKGQVWDNELRKEYLNDTWFAQNVSDKKIRDKYLKITQSSKEDIKGITQESMINTIIEDYLKTSDEYNEKIEENVNAAIEQSNILLQKEQEIGLSTSSLLQAVQGDYSQLIEDISYTLPDQIGSVQKKVHEISIAFGEEVRDTIDNIFEDYNPFEAIANNISLNVDAYVASANAINTFLKENILSDDTIAALQQKFQKIFDLSQLDELSTLQQLDQIFLAQETAIKNNQELLEEEKEQLNEETAKILEEIAKNNNSDNKDFIRNNNDLISQLKTIKDEINKIPSLSEQLETDLLISDLQEATAKLHLYDQVIGKISEDGKVANEDIADVLKAMPELAKQATIDAASGIMDIGTKGLEYLQQYKEHYKEDVNTHSASIQEKIKAEQEYVESIESYAEQIRQAEKQTSDYRTAQADITTQNAVEKYAEQMIENYKKNIQERTQSQLSAKQSITDQNLIATASETQGQRSLTAWETAFNKIVDASFQMGNAVSKNLEAMVTGGELTQSISTGRQVFSGENSSTDTNLTNNTVQAVIDEANAKANDFKALAQKALSGKGNKISAEDSEIIKEILQASGVDVEASGEDGKYTNADLLTAFREYGTESLQGLLTTQAQALGVGNGGFKKSSGSGGGGGKDSSETPDVKDKQKLEHYIKINKQLERQKEILDEIDKQNDRTFGLKKIELYQQEIDGITKEIELLDLKTKEAQMWVSKDLQDIEQYAKTAGLSNIRNLIKVDTEKGLFNKEEFLQQITDEYNQVIDAFNSKVERNELQNKDNPWKFTFLDKEMTADEAKDVYSTITNMLNALESDLDVIHSNELERLENLRKQSDTILEQIMVKLKTYLEVKSLYDTASSMGKKIAEAIGTSLNHELKSIKIDLGEINTYGSIVNANNPLNRSLQAVEEIGSTYNSLIEKMNMGELNTETFKSNMQEIQSNAQSTLDELLGYLNTLEEGVSNVVKSARENFDQFINQLAHNNTIVETAKELMDLQGISYKTAKGFSELQKANKEQLDSALAQSTLNRKFYEELRQEVEYAERQLASATEGTEQYDILKNNRDALLTEFNQAQEAMLSSAKTAMDTATEMYKTAIEKAAYDFSNAISNNLGLDLLSQKYNNYIDIEEQYYDKVNEIFQVNQWNLKLEELIEESTTTARTQALEALKEEIELRRENGSLNEYDMNILEKKLALLQAQQALEDAQQAKNSVRLVRDNQGNWNYQFTADQGAIDEAQSQYNTALNDWYNLAKDQVKNLASEIVQLKQDAADAVKEIYDDLELTTEEREAKLQEVKEYYNEKAKILYQEQQVAIIDMTEAGKMSINDFSNVYAEDLSNMTDNISNFQESFSDYLKECENSLEDYNDTIDYISEESGTNLSDLNDMINEVDQSTKEMENAGNSAIDSMIQSIDDMVKYTTQWSTMADEIIRACEALQEYAQLSANAVDNIASNPVEQDIDDNTDYAREALIAAKNGDDVAASKYLMAREKKTGKANPQSLVNLVRAVVNGDEEAVRIAESVEKEKRKIYERELNKFDTGGYTGDFMSKEGRLAILHSKELVLNQEDTKNILTAVEGIRLLSPAMLSAIEKVLDNSSLIKVDMFNDNINRKINQTEKVVQQQVSIEATFPNVSDSREIEEALNNLTNQAIQYSIKD